MLDAKATRTSTVYVELDALLDTRLGVLARLNPEYAIKAFQDPRYYERQRDDFTEICGVGFEDFKAAYALRDVEVLKASTLTNMPFILHDLIIKLEKEARETPFLDNVAVELNIYPYQLDAEEREVFEIAVQARSGIETMVRAVSIPYEALTPQVCRARYSGMILYNIRLWLEHHMEAFQELQMPQVSVIAPCLHHGEIHTVEDLDSPDLRKDLSIPQMSEFGMLAIFALSLFPIEHYSIFQLEKNRPQE